MDINKIAKNIDTEKKFPPVHLWNPKICPGVSFKIDRNGNWYYQGSIISKHKLKLLFASILKKENNKYYCVTPVEKVLVEVDIAPYAITSFIYNNGIYTFKTNLDYSFDLLANEDLKVITTSKGENIPIVTVRDGIEGFFSRSTFYELVDHAINNFDQNGKSLFILSNNKKFYLS